MRSNEQRRRPAAWAGSGLAALALAVATAVPAAATSPEAPPPPQWQDMYFNANAQKAIVTGTAATAVATVCVTSTGTACVASSGVAAIVTPFIQDQVICPDGGTRVARVKFTMVASPFAPAAGLVYPVATGVESSRCVPG